MSLLRSRKPKSLISVNFYQPLTSGFNDFAETSKLSVQDASQPGLGRSNRVGVFLCVDIMHGLA